MDEKKKRHKYYLEHKEKWKEYGRKWRELNPEKDKAKKAKYRSTAKGKATEEAYRKRYLKEHREEIRIREKKYWEAHKEQKAAKDRRYAERHREELNRKAREKYHEDKKKRTLHCIRTSVNQAIRYGKVEKRPCEVCGATPAEAHHCDYTKPLEVMWLCREHHVEWHKKNKPIYPPQV